jgi:hypothetical protein
MAGQETGIRFKLVVAGPWITVPSKAKREP